MFEGYRVLVVEDEYLLANSLKDCLETVGATVVGPEPSVSGALARIADEVHIDIAVLDVNLGGEDVYPVADALAAQGVPFLFTTGYRDEIVTSRYPAAIICSKPFDMRALFAAMRKLLSLD